MSLPWAPLNLVNKFINSIMPTLTKDVINIDENDDESPSKRRRVQPATDLSYVDLDDDDSPVLITDPTRDQVIDIEGLELELELLEIEDSKSIEQKPTFNAGINRFENYRNAPVVLPWSEIASTKFKDSFLKVGKTVEMKQGGFLYVQKIIQNRLTGSILLRGWKLIRTNNLDGLLPRKLNELCFIHEVDLDDPRPLLEQSVQEVSVADVCKIRKLLKTNKLFPACRFDPSSAGGLNTVEARKFYIMENEVLTVRWRYITTYETAYERLNFEKKYRRRQLEALEDDECTPGYTESRETRLMDWRSESPKGGPVEPRVCLVCQKTYNSICGLQEHPYDIPQSETISLSANSGSYNIDLKNKPSKAPPRKKQYTFGDTCKMTDSFDQIIIWARLTEIVCGAGGMTRAAVDAGFKIKYGIDSDSNPMETWTHNFPDATPYVCEVQKFVSSPGDRSAKQVDVLHISPPCQYFSPVHTVPGKNDEMNFAALYAVCELLKETRPRIVTLEQTFGITWLQKFDYAFKSLIHMFTQLGFSVSWQVALFQNFGLAQHRKRLIIVAAA